MMRIQSCLRVHLSELYMWMAKHSHSVQWLCTCSTVKGEVGYQQK